MAPKTHKNRSFFLLKRSIFLFVLMIFAQNCSSDDNTSSENLENPNVDNIDFTSATTATDSNGNIYEVGFNQVSDINQDPFVIKKNSSGDIIWSITHESSEVDGRAKIIFIDNNDTPWIIFTVVGGSNNTYITTSEVENGAFTNVYQSNYGTGGGPKVSILAKLNPNSGKIQKATFLIAKKNDGKTNGFNVQEVGISNGNIVLLADTVAWPPGKGTSYSRFPDITDEDRIDGVFKMYYEINTTLTEILEAEIFKNQP